jgi:AcrR family transcriptional regulator
MKSDAAAPRPRSLRSDARGNRERIMQAARLVFAQSGPKASLNEIARRAGVGSGTLYRHFPSLQALLVAIISDDVAALCRRGSELLTHPSPDDALRIWLKAVAVHATTMNGLVATEMAARPGHDDGTALAACHDQIIHTGTALLTRAQEHGSTPAHLAIHDLLTLVNAIAWASQQSAGDKNLLDRLLAIALTTSLQGT